jgi:hypothetical protein
MDVYRVTYKSRGEEESQWVSTQGEAEALSSQLHEEEGYTDSRVEHLRVPLESKPDLLDWLNLYAYKGV